MLLMPHNSFLITVSYDPSGKKKAEQAPNYFNTNLNLTAKLDEYPGLLQNATVTR